MSNITPNEYLSLLQRAVEDSLPIRYYFYWNDKVDNVISYIQNNQEKSLEQVWSELAVSLPKLSLNEFCFLYASTVEEDTDEAYESLLPFLESLEEGQKFGSANDFSVLYQEWQGTNAVDCESERRTYEGYMQFVKSLTQDNEPAKLLKVVDKAYTSVFYIDASEDSFTLFNRAEASETIPFIERFDENGKSQVKMVLANERTLIDYNFLKPSSKPIPDVIIFYILINPRKIIEGSYLRAELSLVSGGIKIRYPASIPLANGREEEGKTYIINRIRETFRKEVTYVENLEFSGYVDYANLEFRDDVFYYLMMTDPRFRHFFINEEKRSWASEEGKFKIDYRGFRISGTSLESRSQKTISVSFAIAGSVPNENGDPVTRIHISKALGKREYQSFREEFGYLLGYFTRRVESVNQTLLAYIGQFRPTENKKTKVATKLYPRKIDILKKRAPHIHKSTSRDVQCKQSPIIIDEEDVEAWRDLKVKGEKRHVLLFPPIPKNAFERANAIPDDVPQYYVCPNDAYPYPVVSRVKTRVGKDHPYPVVVKCNTTYKPEEVNLYEVRAEGMKREGRTKENVAKTLIARDYGEKGALPEEISGFLRTLQDGEYIRKGADQGPHALISAVVRGLDEDGIKYLQNRIRSKRFYDLQDERGRESFYHRIRSFFATHPHYFKQEIYDETYEEISQRLIDDVPMDSDRFYHGLEIISNTNIFVFVEGEDGKYYFEIPRSANMNIRILSPGKKSIVLLKTFHPPSTVPFFDHIVTFEEDVSQHLVDAYRNATQTYVWEKANTETNCRLFPYDAFDPARFPDLDWQEVLQYPVVSQYIDGYGKARILNVELEEDQLVSVYILPTQPLDVRVSDEIHPVDTDIIREYFPTPSFISKEGFYFAALDFPYAVFVRSISENDIDESDIPVTSLGAPFSIEIQDSEYTTYRKMKRVTLLLMDSIQWCWRNYPSYIPADEWFDKFVDVGISEEELTLQDESVKVLYPSLPERSSENAIAALSEWWGPHIFDPEGKIHLYRDLREKLRLYFIDLDRKTRTYIPLPPEKYVTSELRSSFLISESNIIFFDSSAYEGYLQSLQHRNAAEIRENVSEKSFFPQLLRLKDGRIYIVQSTKSGKLEEALYVAQVWKNEQINVGESDEMLEDDVRYAIYTQREKGVEGIRDNTGGSTDYFEVLLLGKKHYAMLQLL